MGLQGVNEMLKFILCLLSKDWKKIYKATYRISRMLAKYTASEYDDKKIEEVNAIITAFIGEFSSKQKAIIAKKVTKEKNVIPDIDLNWNEKEGFKVSTKLIF